MCNNSPLIITVLNKFGRNTVYSVYQENQTPRKPNLQICCFLLCCLFVCLYEDVKRNLDLFLRIY